MIRSPFPSPSPLASRLTAYNMEDNCGGVGDTFLRAAQSYSASTPTLYAPGNHETGPLDRYVEYVARLGPAQAALGIASGSNATEFYAATIGRVAVFFISADFYIYPLVRRRHAPSLRFTSVDAHPQLRAHARAARTHRPLRMRTAAGVGARRAPVGVARRRAVAGEPDGDAVGCPRDAPRNVLYEGACGAPATVAARRRRRAFGATRCPAHRGDARSPPARGWFDGPLPADRPTSKLSVPAREQPRIPRTASHPRNTTRPRCRRSPTTASATARPRRCARGSSARSLASSSCCSSTASTSCSAGTRVRGRAGAGCRWGGED